MVSDNSRNIPDCSCPDPSAYWTNEEVQQLHDDLMFWLGTCKTLYAHKLDKGQIREAYIAAIDDALRKIETRKRAVRAGK